MTCGEEPRDDRAPVVAADMGLLTTESLDEARHVIDQVADCVAFLFGRRIGEPVAAQVGRDRKVPCLRQRMQGPRPRLGAFWKPVQEDEHVALRRTVDHGPEANAVRLDHVLARRHFI
jgi:hypothetical protein